MSIKVGDRVRTNEKYAKVAGSHRVGIEFTVTGVRQGGAWVNHLGDELSTVVLGDPMGWGVWANYLDVVKPAGCAECGRGDGQHKLGCSERAAAEPSDAEVSAALDAYYGLMAPVSEDFKRSVSPSMRAALRAAAEVRR